MSRQVERDDAVFSAKAGTWAVHDEESQVQPWIKITVAWPLPVVDE